MSVPKDMRPDYHHEVADELAEKRWQRWSLYTTSPITVDGFQVRNETQVNTRRRGKTPDTHPDHDTGKKIPESWFCSRGRNKNSKIK